tara:strand:+ start:476 stop:898 length:423 start_codon:yes stop_codon:yes gene_type:complete
MAIEITHSDIDVDLTRNSFTGDVSLKQDIHAIRQSIQNILLTKRGEKPFDPFFGSEIDSLLFENEDEFFSVITLKNRVKAALNKIDKRVEFVDFMIDKELSTGDTIFLELTYKIKTVGQDLEQGTTSEIVDGITLTVERA